MEKDIKQILIDFLDEFIEAWEDGSAGDTDLFRKATALKKEINCLEAKPKALHSMKCDEKSQDDTVSRSEIVEAIVKSKTYYEGIGRFDYSSGLDKARYIAATHGKAFEF